MAGSEGSCFLFSSSVKSMFGSNSGRTSWVKMLKGEEDTLKSCWRNVKTYCNHTLNCLTRPENKKIVVWSPKLS